MELIESLSNPWAITPEAMNGIAETIRGHMAGGKLDLAAIQKKILLFEADVIQEKILTFDQNGAERDYRVVNGTAIIPLTGIITKNPSSFMRIILGVKSIDRLMATFDQAVADQDVTDILFHADSPGGTIPGVQEFSYKIFAARKIKPINAFCDSLVASAAIWITAACNKIFISSETVNTGSIGVYTTHYDWSAAEKEAGLKVTHTVAGKFKVVGNQDEPLSKSDKNYIQSRVDRQYSTFTADIAKFRGTTQENVVNNMADGQIFIGSQGIEAGLIDGFSSIERLTENHKDFDKILKVSKPGAVTRKSNPAFQAESPGEEIVATEPKKPQEATKMALKEILAADPLAREEHNAIVEAAVKKNKDEMRAESKELAEFVRPFLSNENYSKSVNAMAAKVQTGEASKDVLTMAVAMHDEMKEALKSGTAQDETDETGDTPAEPGENAQAKAEAAFQAKKIRMGA